MHRKLVALLAGGLVLTGCGSSSSSSSNTSATTTSAAAQLGFEGVPIEKGAELGAASSTGTATVHGISCGPTEQLAYHIHAHLAVYVDGKPRALPGGIGIPGSAVQAGSQGPVAAGGQCIYWLHTHAPDGIIHVESPTQRIYTLGDFFDEWHQPLSATRAGSASGRVTAYVNGKAWTGNPRGIPIRPHAVIQLDVGSPAPFRPVSWSGLNL